jgi:hypothetical protein
MIELYLEKTKVDVDKAFSTMLNYAVSDVKDFGAKKSAFSKTIVLPGSKTNNAAFGHIYSVQRSTVYDSTKANIGFNFNAAVSAKAIVYADNIQVFKGTARLLEIVDYGDGTVDYEVALFGELGGLVFAMGNKRLEDLDFSEYDHDYTAANIVASWSATPGTGYYYPTIDYGQYSTNKIDYDIKSFRPAFHFKEYLDKLFAQAGYTYEGYFFDTAFFKRIFMPANVAKLRRDESNFLDAYLADPVSGDARDPDSNNLEVLDLELAENHKVDFTGTNNYQYTGDAALMEVKIKIAGRYIAQEYTPWTSDANLWVRASFGSGSPFEFFNTTYKSPKIADNAPSDTQWDTTEQTFTIEGTWMVNAQTLDLLSVGVTAYYMFAEVTELTVSVKTQLPILTDIQEGETIVCNEVIPRGLFQKDFLSSVCKMFNLMVDESKTKSKHLIIKPYVDYYNTDERVDWSDKVDRSKPKKIKPMSELNARFYAFKFKKDNDYYNERYSKSYNEGYGDRVYDNGFEFAKETNNVEVLFSSTPLVKYDGCDKIVPVIMKKNGSTEEAVEHNVRVMQRKTITGVDEWDIKDGATVLGSYTSYGYAGHLDDPLTPSADLNFGAPKEMYAQPTGGTLSNNLFNVYYSPYMAEITDPDSKMVTCTMRLTRKDIADLDLSKPVYIDGSLFRINKIENYNATQEDTCTAELLKIINSVY